MLILELIGMKQNRGDIMDKITKTLLVSVTVNICLVISKLIIGFLGSSKALIANGIHSLTDLITDGIAIIGNNLSKKPADAKHPYGYGQIEYVTNIIVGLVILLLGISQVINAFSSDIDIPSNIIIYFSIIAIVVKYALAKYITIKGKEYKSGILIVSGFESKADALTTLFVIISALLSKLTVYNELYKYSDNVCTFVIGLYISYISLKILKENAFDLIKLHIDILRENYPEKWLTLYIRKHFLAYANTFGAKSETKKFLSTSQSIDESLKILKAEFKHFDISKKSSKMPIG